MSTKVEQINFGGVKNGTAKNRFVYYDKSKVFSRRKDGIFKLLTGGCCGILTIIDWFTITNKAKEFNFNKVMTLI